MSYGTWQAIDTAPKDGTWFVTANFGTDTPEYEVGRYAPRIWASYEDAGNGLYRRVEKPILDFEGISNFHRATHWMPLPSPPLSEEQGL